MEKQRSTPLLRFSEFFEDWRITRLENVCDKTISYGIVQTGDNVENGIPCVRVVDLTGNVLDISKMITTTHEISNSYKKTILEEEDIIIALRGEIGMVVKTNSDLIGCNITRGIARISCDKKQIFPDYLLWAIRSPNFIKELNKRVNGSALQEIPLSGLRVVPIAITTLKEQTKIASFLTSVDERILQLTKKKFLLEQYKKGVMQKIFSQEIRFKDENGKEFPEWEEKRLGEIGTFQTSSVDKLNKPDEKEVFLVNYMNVYRHENINNTTKKYLMVVTAKDSQIENSDLKKGDILFTPSSETPDDIGHSVVIFEDLADCVFSYHLMRFRPNVKIDILYSHYFCNIPKVLNQLTKMSTGSTRFTISVKSFSSVVVDLPCIAEQTKIANFLSAIDKKIEGVDKQLEQTKQWKKGLLQQMFC